MLKYKYEYEALVRGHIFKFKSNIHINTVNVLPIDGARMVYFQDAKMTLNIDHIQELKINNKPYKLNNLYHLYH